MIPVKLTLKNFMSYGEEETVLPLEGLHVACLSGDNGNGKSALLDAMTWALWGKTRASSVKSISEDDLIRLGADEVEVRFEFDLSGQRYRVVRKRRRGKSGAQWELTQWDGNGSYLPAGGGSMRETGKQIIQLLSMEYDTFLNSAYLQQGRADEFTRQTPDKRKQILAEILGLDRYDQLEAKAKERLKERKENADELEREIRLLDAQIARLPEYQEGLEQARNALTKLEPEVAKQREATLALRDKRSKLDALAQSLAGEEERYRRMEADIAGRERERGEQGKKVAGIQAVLEQRESILGDYTRLQDALKRREKLEPEVEAFNKASKELAEVIGAIELEEQGLRGNLRLEEKELEAVTARSEQRARLDTQIAMLKEALKAEAEVIREAEQAQEALQEAQEAFGNLKARNEQLKEAVQETDDVLELLARPHATCPVCESDLSGKKHEMVMTRQQEKRAELCRQQEATKKEGVATKQRVTLAEAKVKETTAAREELTRKRSRYEELVKQRDSLIQAGVEVEAVRQRVEKLRGQLERGEFAAPKRAHQKRLNGEVARLQLAKVEFETVRETIRRLGEAQTRYEKLRHAEDSLEPETAALVRLETDLAAKRKERESEQEKLQDLRAQLKQYEQVKAEVAVAEAERTRLEAEMNRLKVGEGSYIRYIEGCDQAAQQKKTKAEAYRKADEERRIYQVLAMAFGKKGVQALIIENITPELEDEANSLLARMTDNALQVNIATTRAAKTSGSEIETLDIKITDHLGTRPYELFSGGEAFRVNFAIRIALSRLLARRSGAKLQTLILDEGFGTQDGKGREKLIEVIDTIKDDFEKILVITHVEELKDSFAQRIEVTKDAGGSRIHLL